MSVSLLYGNTKLYLSAQQRYFKEELIRRMSQHNNQNHWILIDNVRIKLQNNEHLDLACELVSAYHNAMCFDENDRDSQYTETILDQWDDNENALDSGLDDEDWTNT